MKKTALLFGIIFGIISLKAQTIFTVGGDAVSKTEFLNNYYRNKETDIKKDKSASLKENLDLYIKYKLKVKAAYDAHLDTLQNQKDDLEAFKRQIEGKYLTEDKMMKNLAQEAFGRMQKDIRISHILVLINKTTNDTAAALKKITEAYNKLKQGNDFATIAKQYSEDASVATNGGDIGFINVFVLPYNLETLAYSTPKNKFSQIYKSTIGYHIFKNTEERPAIGKMKAAQILIQIQPNADQASKDIAKKKIDDIYEKIKAGDSFENLARAYSNDMYSANAGGLMQEFSVGKYDVNFENTFVGLKNNEFSKPFLTSFGWHILKRIENISSKTLDKETEQELVNKINTDSRKEKAEETFLQTILKSTQYKFNTTINKDQLMQLTNDKLQSKTSNLTTTINDNTQLLSYANKKHTVGDFYNFINDTKSNAKFKNYSSEKLLNEFTKATAFEYYKNHLEEFNPEFKSQVKEFKDGNLLFEIMERDVWNKSTNDETGLKNLYNNNRNKYKWKKSADALIFSTNNLNDANSVAKEIKEKPQNWKEIIVKYQSTVNADSGRFELNNIPSKEGFAYDEKTISTPISPNNDNNYVFAYIIKSYPDDMQRSFDEAKGLVINDYQITLEENWITNLKKKYPIVINNQVWDSLIKTNK